MTPSNGNIFHVTGNLCGEFPSQRPVTWSCKLTIIGANNGLSPRRRQAIIWTNDGLLLTGTLRTNFSEILNETHKLTFSFKTMHLKMASAKWRPFSLGINVLMKHSVIAFVMIIFGLIWRSVTLTYRTIWKSNSYLKLRDNHKKNLWFYCCCISLVDGRFEGKFRKVNCKLFWAIYGCGIVCEIPLMWLSHPMLSKCYNGIWRRQSAMNSWKGNI